LLYFVRLGVYGATYRDRKLSVSLCVFRAPLQPPLYSWRHHDHSMKTAPSCRTSLAAVVDGREPASSGSPRSIAQALANLQAEVAASKLTELRVSDLGRSMMWARTYGGPVGALSPKNASPHRRYGVDHRRSPARLPAAPQHCHRCMFC
jgi:hypothetical protein